MTAAILASGPRAAAGADRIGETGEAQAIGLGMGDGESNGRTAERVRDANEWRHRMRREIMKQMDFSSSSMSSMHSLRDRANRARTARMPPELRPRSIGRPARHSPSAHAAALPCVFPDRRALDCGRRIDNTA
ncbi:hypothetical protein [Burkholderia pseudomallei]|uniref:hypothetical protein n=1 Tax=Burkholderia pseudomallei TaxID=28450 RepID=UPI001416F6AD|nr:hypothetical protein [Burkholderia pseudomallei]